MRILEQYLLEDPWPVVVGLIVLFAVIRVIGRRSGRSRWVQASLLPLGLASAVAFTAHLVDTPVERLIQRTDAFMQATVQPNFAVLDGIIDPQATFHDEDGKVRAQWPEIRERLAEVSIDSQSVTVTEIARIERYQAAMHITARTELGDEAIPGVQPTRWIMIWSRGEDDDWRISQMHWLSWRGQDASPLWSAAMSR